MVTPIASPPITPPAITPAIVPVMEALLLSVFATELDGAEGSLVVVLAPGTLVETNGPPGVVLSMTVV